MANNTVYPYGTDGQLPTGIGIINDLVTGGADKALSAEQGKVLNKEIAIRSSVLPTGTTASNGIFFVDAELNIGASITDDGIQGYNLITSEDL